MDARRGISWLLGQPHLLLAAHLLVLHGLVFWWGSSLEARLISWPVAMGLFLLWQPLVAGGQRLGTGRTLLLVALVCAWALVLKPWLLLLWCATLAALIGGRGLRLGGRRNRLALLLAFAYLLCLMMLGLVPQLPADPAMLGQFPRGFFAALLPLLILPLPFFASEQPAGEGEVDFIHSLLIFLLLAVFMLGSLAVAFLHQSSYGNALFVTSLSLGGGLLLLAWAWNPRAGFAGIGAAFARYLLSIGMPMEEWLRWLSEESRRTDAPDAFLRAALGRLADLPWLTGVRWRGCGQEGELGSPGPGAHLFEQGGLRVELSFRMPPAPALRWHFDWLLRLLLAFYQVKLQARELQVLGYEKAIHETGARVTHDVKNILQSLQNLCFAASQAGEADSARLGALIQQQLPILAERLQGTLGRLQAPAAAGVGRETPARDWWQAVQALYRDRGVLCEGPPEADLDDLFGAGLPAELFDSVAENLLQNALTKRQREPGLRVALGLRRWAGGWGLEVADDGSPLAEELAGGLFRGPLASEDGLGVGLYHGARQAALCGYALELSENRAGRVCFSLRPQPSR